jgi:hypothetical protein
MKTIMKGDRSKLLEAKKRRRRFRSMAPMLLRESRWLDAEARHGAQEK